VALQELVAGTLTALLSDTEDDGPAIDRFVEGLQVLDGGLNRLVEWDGGPLAKAVAMARRARHYFRTGHPAEARSFLIAARGHLAALTPRPPAPPVEPVCCDFCEGDPQQHPPAWAYPALEAAAGSDELGADGTGGTGTIVWVACADCAAYIDTRDDVALARAMGYPPGPILPRRVRSFRDRVGPRRPLPDPHPDPHCDPDPTGARQPRRTRRTPQSPRPSGGAAPDGR
jgi:hypothetical protein